MNIVRRKVELKCPAETIPNEIIVDLTGTDIGTSIKISSVKLPDNVKPTITDRDFVVATVAALPTKALPTCFLHCDQLAFRCIRHCISPAADLIREGHFT